MGAEALAEFGGDQPEAGEGGEVHRAGGAMTEGLPEEDGQAGPVAAAGGLGAEIDEAEAAIGAAGEERPGRAGPGEHGAPIVVGAEGVGSGFGVDDDEGVFEHFEGDSGLFGDAQDEGGVLVVRAGAELGSLEGFAGEHVGRGRHVTGAAEEGAAVEEVVVDGHVGAVQLAGPDVGGFGHQDAAAAAEHDLAVAGGVEHAFEHGGQEFVVVVEEGDPGAAGEGGAGVAGAAGAAGAGVGEDAEAGVGDGGEGGGGGRVGAVDDGDDLEIWHRLIKDAVDRALDQVVAARGGYNDRDAGGRGGIGHVETRHRGLFGRQV